jgi:glycosyltransferase involved in cell wall biosynthesis
MDRDAAAIVERTAVVIPAFNAARELGGVIADVARHVPRERIIVVDDGSSDDTADSARAAGAVVIEHEHNRGKGAALRTGILAALDRGHDFAITLDADGQHSPDEIPRFVRRRLETGADLIVGDRMGATEDMPFLRLATNRLTSWVVSRLARSRIPDSQNGYRMIDTRVFADIPLVTTRYDTESEILIRAGRRGAAIDSVPVRTIYGEEESSINPVVDTLRFFRMVLRALFW